MPSLPLIRRLLFEYGRRHAPGYALTFGLMAIAAAATGGAAYIMKDVINQIFLEKNAAAIWGIATLVVGLYVAKGFAMYGQEIVLSRIGAKLVAAIQVRMFDHLLAQAPPYFSDKHSTQFIAQQSFMASSAQSALDLVVKSMGRDALTLVSLTTVMVIQDPLMSIGALVLLPLALFGIQRLMKRMRSMVMTEFSAFSTILETVQETVRGFHVVKSFGLTRVMRERMVGSIRSIQRATVRLSMIKAGTTPLMETLGGFAIAGIIVYGGWRVVHEGQTPGQFFSFITAFLLAYDPARRLARLHVELNNALIGVGMLYQFLDSPVQEPEVDPRPGLTVDAGAIAFEGVTFAYRADEPVLRDLSFLARPGATTALIGPSGSGKSTIFALLQGFYRPTAGRLLIDGQDIHACNLASVRAAIAVVSQDAFLFKGTIRENIGYGRVGASDDDIIAAAKAAYAHDFISGFALGYDTPVGEHGITLSGGQRQRIAIARAFLKDAPIILLDEATSALDVTSERYVREALAALGTGRTVLLIAHRIESYQHADVVFDLKALNGRDEEPSAATAA